MKKTIGMAALLLTSSFAQAKFVTTEDTAKQQQAAHQAEQKVKGFYLGGAIGSTAFDSLDYDTPYAEEDGSTLKFIIGYQFNRVFALEGQYTTYGDINETVTDYSWSPTAASLSANLGYTFRNGLRPFGVIGVSSIELGQPYMTNLEDNGVGLRYGFGLEYAPIMLSGFSARVGYEIDVFGVDLTDPTYNYTEVRSYTLSSFYVSASYKF
ncbi:MAG: porin family protein [Moritella sp.]|uniref:porin family protein n=1 Tax=Moritella sp. TaxID=78556 RepID=UPI0025D76A9E|nr:porin family protein [Moritella sp.]NQZ92021.1 porin family protein [Moritella sp.]